MFFITAIINITLPFRTTIKEGDSYEVIEKNLDNGGKITLYPFEYLDNIRNLHAGNFVNSFRKIRIDITLPFASNKVDFSKREQQRPFLDVADEYLNLFLMHCRTKSKQFWWYPIYLNSFNMSQIWFDIKFLVDNTLLYEQKGSWGGMGPVGVGINGQIWDKIKCDLLGNFEPSIVDFFVEEARGALFSKSVSVLIINTAIALEIFTSRFCLEYARKIGKDADAVFKSYLDSNDSFVVKNFKKIIPYLTSINLNVEDKDKYQQVDFLFRTRNKIVHTGEPFYIDDSGTKIKVNFEKSREFFWVSLDVFEWVRKIDANIAEQLKCFIDLK